MIATLIPLACLAYLHWEDARVAAGEAPARHWWNIFMSGSDPAQISPTIAGDRVYLPPGWDGGLLPADEHAAATHASNAPTSHLPVTELLHFLRQLSPAHFHHHATPPPAREAAPRMIQASN
ncbi:MAG: hypothetical protein KF886_02825 [Candidatus Hydrogenedentes bacterium]|nr:hypothetical protein [Candidatus Hydrogenedentota bacterium]